LKKYELLSIIKPNLDIDEVEKVISNLEETINKFGGKVSNNDKLGRKKLAYDIENYRDGFFVVTNFELEEAKVFDLKRSLKLNDNFLRAMLVEDTAKVKTPVV
jgi:small subunit ribosomal protein S6